MTRRFQVIQIDEPCEKVATNMLRALAPSLEEHHQVMILDQAIQAAVKLSHRYIPARQLPVLGLLSANIQYLEKLNFCKNKLMHYFWSKTICKGKTD